VNAAKDDDVFMRVCGLLEGMLESGRRALETKVEDFVEKKGGARVLHEVEARSWRVIGYPEGEEEGKDAMTTATEQDEDDPFYTTSRGTETDDDLTGTSPSRPQSAVPVDNNSFRSEDEVEGMLDSHDSPELRTPESLSRGIGIAI